MSCNFSQVSADSKGLHLSWTTWNLSICFVSWYFTCKSHSPMGFIVEPPKSLSLTVDFWIGGSPNWVMADRLSRHNTLHVAPVSSWHDNDVVKSSFGDLKNWISVNHCLAFVSTSDTVSKFRQASSSLDVSKSSNWFTFFVVKHTDEKWPFFPQLLQVFPNAGQSVLFTWRCCRPQYLHVKPARGSLFIYIYLFIYLRCLYRLSNSATLV